MTARPEDLLRALGDEPVPDEERVDEAARRGRMVGAIAGAVRREAEAKRARTRRARFVGGLLAAAAVLAGVGAAWRFTRMPAPAVATVTSGVRLGAVTGVVVRVHAGAPTAASGGAGVDVGDEVETRADGEAQLVLGSGATVQIAAASTVRLDAPARGERLRLHAGQAAFLVPVLGEGSELRVATPDLEIETRGAAWTVVVRDGAPPRTRIHVNAGAITVHVGGDETIVRAGEDWPAIPPTPTPTPTSTSTSTSTPTSTSTSTSTSTPTAPASAPRASTLAEQNQLLQSAADARRRGDNARCLALLDELLSRYPRSPLGQEARVEHFRTLERMGRHAQAVAEARRYLADFPTGFARDEAQSLVLGTR